MSWISVEVDVPVLGADALANFLVECGSPGVSLSEHGGRSTVTGYFDSTAPTERLRRYCEDLGLDDVTITSIPLDAQDWAENWKLHSKPQCVGKRLYIAPSWAWAPRPDQIGICIDPGMAFGTGQHATTRGCLELIESELSQRPVGRALDLGTGSGILAIAMAKLGAQEVVAIDNDPLACSIARQCIRENDCEPSVSVHEDLGAAAGGFDLIVANLFADLLVELAPTLMTRLAPQGVLVLSGFIEEDGRRILEAFQAQGAVVRRQESSEGWLTLALARGPG